MSGLVSRWALILFVIRSVSVWPVRADNCSLVSLIILHRHSFRAPLNIPSNVDFASTEDYRNGLGRVTDRGFRCIDDFAAKFVEWYPTVIKADARDIKAISSFENRCYMTVERILRKVFNNESFSCETSRQEAVPYKVIPIEYPPKAGDTLAPCAHHDCSGLLSRLGKLLQKMVDKPLPKGISTQVNTLGEAINLVKQLAGVNGSSSEAVQTLMRTFDVIYCQEYHGKRTPEWYQKNIRLTRYLNSLLYNLMLTELKVSGGCNLGRRIAESLRELKGGSSTKVWFFSFHDVSVSSVAQLLDLKGYLSLWPHFLGALFFEVYHCGDGVYILKVLYSKGFNRNLVYRGRVPLKISACGNSNECPIDKMIELLDGPKYCQR